MPTTDPLDLGGIEVYPISGGKNLVDGGWVMGILPKKIWNRWYPADEENRILLESHCLLVRTSDETLLIETGCGNKLDAKEQAFHGAFQDDWIEPNLRAAGFSPEEINRVVLTHMHTDHIGGALKAEEAGEFVPTFPNALVTVCKGEFEDATNGRGITPVAYNNKNFEVLLDQGLLETVDPDARLSQHIRFVSTPGHTPSHQSVLIEGSVRTLLFAGDLLAMKCQATPHFNMAVDTAPVIKIATKRRILEEALNKEWILMLAHEPQSPFYSVSPQKEKARFRLEPLDSGLA